MPKSKYPNKLDTSIEIPAVRDNIVEVGSDVLNSIRSALFQIERTLGVNPQGAVGNTVSDRLNKALDGNGNILKEALDRSNVLSGPITDSDVSKVAAINESKLRLNYPTNLLQEEIAQLINEVNSMIATIEELSVLFNAHVHASATNRHLGQAITIESIDSTTSSTGMVSIEATTSQGAFESIFESHINYDGSDISLTNRSHEADQLFFDNEESSSYIDSDDVQGAIEETLGYATSQMSGHQNRQHDNSMDRTAAIFTSLEDDEGVLILDEESIQYSATTTGNTDEAVTVTFSNTPDIPDATIKKSDILKITNESGSFEYQINKAIYSEDGTTLDQVEIFARFVEDSGASATGKIYRNINTDANFGGLLVTVREYESGETDDEGIEISNADILQVSNPDAATIITKGIRPSEIVSLSVQNRYFDISVDGGTAVSLDVYDGTAPVQSIETILKKLNEQFAANSLSVSAYRVDYDEKKASEIAIVHSIPSSSETSYTLKVSRGDDDALDSMGLADFEDLTIDAGLGTNYYIQGESHNGLNTKFSETGEDLTFLAGTPAIISTTINFEENGVCEGDLVVIAGSDSDDGTYVVLHVQSDQITVDSNQLSGGEWAGVTSDETNFYIYNNSISLRGLAFDAEPDGDTTAYIADVFMDYNRSIFYNIRMAYGALESEDTTYASLVTVVDFSGDISVYTDESPGEILIEKSSDGNPLFSLDGGAPMELGAVSNAYMELASGIYDIRLMLFVEDYTFITGLYDFIYSGVGETPDFSKSMELNGFEGINEEENLLLARAHYEAKQDRVTGAGTDYPRIFSKLRRGGTGQGNLGSDAIFANQQRPLRETRSNGVIRGLEVTPSATQDTHESIDGNGHYVINMAGGVCYVKGKRFELDAKADLATGIPSPWSDEENTTDKLFIAIDQWGGVVFASAGSEGSGAECASPFDPYDYCVLCTIEYNGDGEETDGDPNGDPPFAIDLRLFIDQLDFKVLNSITVSPQRGMGHFDNIGDAIRYAKRFSEAYSKAGVPTVHLKSGVHKVIIDTGVEAATDSAADEDNYYQAASDYGLWINFPVNIVGEGNSTILDIQRIHSDEGVGDDDRTETDEPDHKGFLPIAGPGLTSTPDYNSDVIEGGFVNLSNFRMRLCSIWVLDPTIYTEGSSGDSINWGVNIDNVIFDQTEKTGFDATNLGVCLRSVNSSDSTDYIGNVKISNCQFLNSHIKTVDWLATLHKNISILHNVFSGDGAGNPASGDHYGLYIGGDGHLSGFDTDDPPHENNIRIVGNVYTDDDGAAHIDQNENHLWGDRIGRLGVSDLTIDGSISATMTDLVISKDSSTSNPHLIIHEENTHAAKLYFTNTNGTNGDSNNSYEWEIHADPGEDGALGDDTIGPTTATFDIKYADYDSQGGTESLFKLYGNGRLGINATPGAGTTLALKGRYDEGQEGPCSMVMHSGTESGEDADIGIYGYVDGSQAFGFGWDASSDVISLGPTMGGNSFNINSSGKVGIGCIPNTYVLQAGNVEGGTTIAAGRIEDDVVEFYQDTWLGSLKINSSTDGGASWDSVISIAGYADKEDWRAGEYPTRLEFRTTPIGSDSSSVCMTIASDGYVCIGTDTAPDYPLDVHNSVAGDYIAKFENEAEGTDDKGIIIQLGNTASSEMTTSNKFIRFNDGDGTEQGYIRSDGDRGIEIADAFTGAHPTVMPAEDFMLGLIVESTGELWANGIKHVSTAIPKARLSSSDNSKTVFGVIAEKDSHPGYQERWGVSEGEVQVYINGLGEGKVWVTDKDGNIENGDYITTSVVPGYGTLQSDDILRNYTVAKCTEAVDWSQVTETIDHDGLTYKKYLIACTYHCS